MRCVLTVCFFFKQKTAYEMRISDWSSDVCSSDLDAGLEADDPRDPGHPAHALDRRIRGEVAKAESRIGKSWDESSERLAANLFGLAREKGFSAHDELKVGFNRRTAGYEAGELVFVYREGGNVSPDPYANRSEEHTSELQLVMSISYAGLCVNNT